VLEELGRLCRGLCAGHGDYWGCYSTCVKCWEGCGGDACVEGCVKRLAPRRRRLSDGYGGVTVSDVLEACGSLLTTFLSRRASVSSRVIAKRLGVRTGVVSILLSRVPVKTVVADGLGRQWVYLGRKNGRAFWARAEEVEACVQATPSELPGRFAGGTVEPQWRRYDAQG